MAANLHHVALFVKDMDRALHVFQKLFGFRLVWRVPRIGGAKLSAVLGMPNMHAEIAYLEQNPAGVAVEFIRLLNEPGESASGPSGTCAGTILSLVVQDLELLHRNLSEGGWQPFTPVLQLSAPDGTPVEMFCFRVDEGLTIELIRPSNTAASAAGTD